jgi:hypothetical protein
LIERRHSAQSLAAMFGRSSALTFMLVAGLAGCHHNPPQLPYVSMASPLELEEIPPPDDLPMIAEEPTPEIAPPTQPVEAPKPVVRRRPPTPVKETPPVQVASAADPAALLGELSSGGESNPQSQQQAKDMIASITKRLAALPSKLANQQKDLVRQVRSFLKQAQQALGSGDAEGAKNLATKAKLLMDDVEKK